MPARTPIERAIATYCRDWVAIPIESPSYAQINAETLAEKTNIDHRFRYIDISSVDKGSIDWNAVQSIRFGDAPSRARRIVRPGDLMICTVRPLLGSHAHADWVDDTPTVCSTGFAVVRTSGKLRPEFLRLLPFTEQVTRQLVAWQCGTNYPAVNERDIRRLVVPAPSPDEQAAIARVLDAVDAAIDRAREAVRQSKDLLASLITESVNTCAIAHKCAELGTLISDGPTNGLYRPESDYGAKGTPIVRIDSFADGTIASLSALRRVVVPMLLRERFVLQQGDVLINRVNALTHVGKAAVVPKLSEPTIFESNMMRLRCADGLLPDFLGLILRSDIARRHWLARAKPAVNQVSINQRDVKALRFPLPDTERQREVTRAVSAADAVVAHHSVRLDAYHTLKKSLMHDLLTGTVRVDPVLFAKEATA